MLKKDLNDFIKNLSEKARTTIIRNALADDIPFESIKVEYKLTENEVVYLMKKSLPQKQFVKWRARAKGSGLKNQKQAKIKKEFIEELKYD